MNTDYLLILHYNSWQCIWGCNCVSQSHGGELVTPRRLSKGRFQWVLLSLHICIDSEHTASLTLCVCVSGCCWKPRARTSVRSPAWCLRRRSVSWCGTGFCPGPSTATYCRTPGGSRVPSSTWSRSTRRRRPSSRSSSLTPSASPVRMDVRVVFPPSLCVQSVIMDYGFAGEIPAVTFVAKLSETLAFVFKFQALEFYSHSYCMTDVWLFKV